MQQNDLDELERIWKLKQAGAISDEEFERLKAGILRTSDVEQPASEAEAPTQTGATDGGAIEGRSKGSGPLIAAAVIGVVVLLIIIGAANSDNSVPTNNVAIDQNLTTADLGNDATASAETALAAAPAAIPAAADVPTSNHTASDSSDGDFSSTPGSVPASTPQDIAKKSVIRPVGLMRLRRRAGTKRTKP